jgi:hypothetical protein
MKSFFDVFLSAGLRTIFAFLIDLVKVDLLTFYTRVILGVRSVFSIGVLAGACLLLFMSGFLIIHWALFILLPWSLATKGFVLLALGLIYFITPLVLLITLTSKRRWLKLLETHYSS